MNHLSSILIVVGVVSLAVAVINQPRRLTIAGVLVYLAFYVLSVSCIVVGAFGALADLGVV